MSAPEDWAPIVENGELDDLHHNLVVLELGMAATGAFGEAAVIAGFDAHNVLESPSGRRYMLVQATGHLVSCKPFDLAYEIDDGNRGPEALSEDGLTALGKLAQSQITILEITATGPAEQLAA